MRIAICPGSFDPVTLGHVDMIKRAALLFDKVIVTAMINSEKKYAFTIGQRVDMLKKSLAGIENVEVDSFDGLFADYAIRKNASCIVKGVRNAVDFEYEYQIMLVNKRLCPDIETVFLAPASDYLYLNSTVVKEYARNGAPLKGLVHDSIIGEVQKVLSRRDVNVSI